MADPTTNISGRSGFRRGLSELVDRMFLGNRAHNYQTGYWNRQGAIEGGVQGALGSINPLLGLGLGQYYRWRDRHNANNSPMGLDLAQLDPAQRMTFNYGGPQFQPGVSGPQTSPTFDPNNPFALPTQPSAPAAQPDNRYGAFTPNPNLRQPTTSGFRSLLGPAMGGARGRFDAGGSSISGDAARAMFAGMTADKTMQLYDPTLRQA